MTTPMPETGTTPTPATGTTTPEPSTDQPEPKPETGQETDWKQHSREWEKRAKANSKAQEDLAKANAELEKLRKQNMTDQEKALTEAKEAGKKEAASTYGRQLALAELRAALAGKNIDLGDVADLVDPSKLLGEDGQVDNKAIKAAVDKLAKLAPATPTPGRSGGDFQGAGGGQPITEEQLARMSPNEINKAYDAGQLKHLL